MKSIIFVRNLNSEEDIKRIQEALTETRVEYSIALERKAVVVDGSNDIVHAAKVSLREAGYIVE